MDSKETTQGTRNALNRSGYLAFYNEASYKYPEAELTLENIHGRHRIRRILELLSSHAKQGHLLLDAGCGGGVISLPYCQAGGKAIAMDIGPGFIEYARQQAESFGISNNLSFVIGDICDICLGAALFDVVVCAEVLEHVLEPVKAIKEFERVLKPGGTLIITVPNPLRISFSLHGMRNMLRALVSLAFGRLIGNRKSTTEFPLGASREYDIKPTIYKHTEFAPFEFNNMLPAKLQILRSWSIVHSFCRIIKNEGSNYRFSKLAEKAALLNMMGTYSLLLAKKLTL